MLELATFLLCLANFGLLTCLFIRQAIQGEDWATREDVEWLFKKIARLLPPRKASQAYLYAIVNGHKRRWIKMDFPVGSKVTGSVEFKDAGGRHARVDGVPTWSASPEGAVSLTPTEDGMGCEIECLESAPEGDVVIQCSADADLGAGVEPIIAQGTLTVVAGKAVIGTMSFGELH